MTAADRYAKIAVHFQGQSGVSGPWSPGPQTAKFGATSLKINDQIFAMLDSGNRFVVKLPAAIVADLVVRGLGEPFQLGKRVMKEWVVVVGTDENQWLDLANQAKEFVVKNKL